MSGRAFGRRRAGAEFWIRETVTSLRGRPEGAASDAPHRTRQANFFALPFDKDHSVIFRYSALLKSVVVSRSKRACASKYFVLDWRVFGCTRAGGPLPVAWGPVPTFLIFRMEPRLQAHLPQRRAIPMLLTQPLHPRQRPKNIPTSQQQSTDNRQPITQKPTKT